MSQAGAGGRWNSGGAAGLPFSAAQQKGAAMLWNLDELKGLTLEAVDGRLGHVHDVLFADDSWHVRYLVVDTGWIFGRRVLIGPQALGQPNARTRTLPVSLTQEQIRNSPSINTDRPVDRQQEDALHAYYGWAPYWTAGGAMGLPGGAPTLGLGATGLAGADLTGAAPGGTPPTPGGDPHLRSARELQGYDVRANRASAARLSTLLLETEEWCVRWLVADTGSMLTSRLVLLAPDWVRGIDWAAATVTVATTPDRLDAAPTYDPTRPPSAELEQATWAAHGRRPPA